MKLCYVATNPEDGLEEKQEVILFDYIAATFKQFTEIKEEVENIQPMSGQFNFLDPDSSETIYSHLICWN